MGLSPLWQQSDAELARPSHLEWAQRNRPPDPRSSTSKCSHSLQTKPAPSSPSSVHLASFNFVLKIYFNCPRRNSHLSE